MTETPFRIAFVPGVTPGKWLRTWDERARSEPLEATMVEEAAQLSCLYDGAADMCFVRLPVDRDRLNVIPLYYERPVVVVPKEHLLTALDEVSLADLVDEIVLEESADLTVKQAVETVAAGTGVIVVPMSVARLHQRKDVETRPVTDVPDTQIGLAWLAGNDDPRIERFIGIVRGRTARSSREAPTPPQPKKTAKRPAPKTTGARTPKPRKAARPVRKRG